MSNAMRYWQDPEHFNHEMGDLMLDEIFGQRPDRAQRLIGRRVSLRELEQRVPAFWEERTRFIQSHPWFYQQLRALLPKERWRETEPSTASASIP